MVAEPRFLVVEDSPEDAELIARELRRTGLKFSSQRVEARDDFLKELKERPPDLVFCDYKLPGLRAEEILAACREAAPPVPVIVISGSFKWEDTAVELLQSGAADYLIKGNLRRLESAVRRTLEIKRIQGERRRAEEALKQSEQQLRQAQKMEAVGRLAGGVAHDFNNMLTAILGYTEILLGGFEPKDQRRQDLEEVIQAAKRAAALTQQLLAFSRRQVLSPRVVELNAVVSGIKNMLQRIIGEDIEVQVLPDPALGRVRVDPGQIEQVILNLAVNARDAMPKGGRLTLKTANMVLDGEALTGHPGTKPGPYVQLSVADTGSGMDEETKTHLFEPFFTTKERGKGTGLGLSTVYGIVKQSGGYIYVESQVGMGTVFKILFPRVEAQAEPPEPALPPARPVRASEAILLVEDEDVVRGLASRILRRAGYTVLEARHPEDALRIFDQRRSPIHLMLTDVVMPGISGPELARKLGAGQPNLKVLFMSGYTDEEISRDTPLRPGHTLLPKPFTPGELLKRVGEVLGAPVPSADDAT